MEQTQGQPAEQNPDAPEAQGQPAQTPAVPPELQQFVADPPANGNPAPTEGQPQAQAPPQQDDNAKELLRLANQRQADIYRLQQENERYRQEQQLLMQRFVPQQQVQQNPYDASNNPTEFWRWEFSTAASSAAKQSAEEARRATREELFALSQQAAEYQWAQNHPGVDTGQVKAYAQANGIATWNLELAHRDMTRGQSLQNVAQATAQSAISQFRQQPTGALPLRPQGASPGSVGLSFEKMLEQYAANPSIADTWHPELQQKFRQELYHRRANAG